MRFIVNDSAAAGKRFEDHLRLRPVMMWQKEGIKADLSPR
jgi:hypothetical protein